MKCAIKKKTFDNNNYIILTLLQIRPVAISKGLPSLATHLFNRPVRAFLLDINRDPINIDADDENYEALKA